MCPSINIIGITTYFCPLHWYVGEQWQFRFPLHIYRRGIMILAVVLLTDILPRWNHLVVPYTNMIEKTDNFWCYFQWYFCDYDILFVSCTDIMCTNDTLHLPCTDMMWNNKILVHLSVHIVGNNDKFFVPYTIMKGISDTIGCSL